MHRLLGWLLACSALLLLMPWVLGSGSRDRADRPQSFDGSTPRATPGFALLPIHGGHDEEDEEDEHDGYDEEAWHGDEEDESEEDEGFVTFFEDNPLIDPANRVAGAALGRLEWAADPPAFAGDRPGSLTGTYDANLEAGWFGLPLPRDYGAADAFTAAAVLIIRSEGFQADPDGFFQLSWGVWNSTATGLNRTGTLQSFAVDTFELVSWDYFPSVSPFFGGPFLSPSIFGTDDGSGDAFTNFASLFDLEVALPFDVPLLAILEHRPDDDALTVQMWTLGPTGKPLPLTRAVGVADLGALALREYELDTIGLTLWNDGFGDPDQPAVRARVEFHALSFHPGLALHPLDAL